MSSESTPSTPPVAPSRFGLGILTAVVVAVAVAWVWKSPIDRRQSQSEPVASAESEANGETPPPAPPRCVRSSDATHRIGKPGPIEESAPGGDDERDEDLAAAFGAEVSRAVRTGSGFALGVRLDSESGAQGGVALVERDVKSGSLVDLGRSRGDFDAPLVTATDDGLVAALLEPNASGGALKVAVLRADASPRWTVELELARDESLAFDLAAGPKAVVLAWDDVTKNGETARVVWTALDAHGEKVKRKPAAASSKAVDAETPRVVTRPGGFWLAYIARKSVKLPAKDGDDVLGRTPEGDRYAAEKIDPSWIELLPLDESGSPVGSARAVTERSGHALSFDLATTEKGDALIAWRDDDTPSGSHGGRVSLLGAALAGGERRQLLVDSDVGAGSPTLLDGWVSVPNSLGQAMLAPLGPDGEVNGELRLEPAIGAGDPLAARGDTLLVATSLGTAVELTTVRCTP